MKLRNNRFRYYQNKGYLESIGWEQLRNCIFRFLKEFGFYGKYIKDIKPYMVEEVGFYFNGESYIIETVPISFKKFIRKYDFALSRNLFPFGNFWNEVYDLWKEWSFEEDKIYSKTHIQ